MSWLLYNAAMSTWVHQSLKITVFFLDLCPGMIAGSYGNFLVQFLTDSLSLAVI